MNATTRLFLAIAAAFAVLYVVDDQLYESLLVEDRLVENATSAGLVASAVLFGVLASRRRRGGPRWQLAAMLSALLVIAALEEISWGQRLLGLESPEFFERYSDQREINLHGAAQRFLAVRTKDVVGLGALAYGVLIPWLLERGTLRFAPARFLTFPPRDLRMPIVIAAAFMIDVPTGREEEIGEFLLSICLVLIAAHEVRATREAASSPVASQAN